MRDLGSSLQLQANLQHEHQQQQARTNSQLLRQLDVLQASIMGLQAASMGGVGSPRADVAGAGGVAGAVAAARRLPLFNASSKVLRSRGRSRSGTQDDQQYAALQAVGDESMSSTAALSPTETAAGEGAAAEGRDGSEESAVSQQLAVLQQQMQQQQAAMEQQQVAMQQQQALLQQVLAQLQQKQ